PTPTAADHRVVDTDAVVKVGVIVAVLVVLWVLPDWPTYRARTVRLGQALRLLEPPPPRPAGPPIEQIAADLRRIRSQIEHVPPGTPVARRRGWLEAYDDLLVSACRALGMEQEIDALPEGPRRDLERERVERSLVRAGLEGPRPRR